MGAELQAGDTIALLKECSAGCKTATNSLEQMMDHVQNDKLLNYIKEMDQKHIELGEECHKLLHDANREDEDPKGWAKAMAWVTTEAKMAMKGDSHEAASILIDGCNMGVKSLSEYKNKYHGASEDAVRVCEKLIKLEADMMKDLREYL